MCVCGITVRDDSSGALLILLAKDITPDMQGSAIGRMEAGGHFDEAKPLWHDARGLLVHLFLHELTHTLLARGTSEGECDEWAFAHLPRRHAPAAVRSVRGCAK